MDTISPGSTRPTVVTMTYSPRSSSQASSMPPISGLTTDIATFYGRLEEPKELVTIDAADHLFDGKTQEVGEALEDLLSDFSS